MAEKDHSHHSHHPSFSRVLEAVNQSTGFYCKHFEALLCMKEVKAVQLSNSLSGLTLLLTHQDKSGSLWGRIYSVLCSLCVEDMIMQCTTSFEFTFLSLIIK